MLADSRGQADAETLVIACTTAEIRSNPFKERNSLDAVFVLGILG